MPDLPIIDQEAIENLRMLGDEEGDDSFLKEVIEIFVTDTPVRLTELRTSLAAGDQTTFTRAAHSIKGSSSNVGAQRLGAMAKDLEADSREHLNGLAPRIEELNAAFLEAKTALEAL
ncbi:Hpt domain-containing protein [Actomonas aquatica]|uniref:Hpt domain-containing protein n=1 Tax=Actomonas aquatica TaxID=2866162 RepID=A0ABZ1C937_9BACT|nr:Hpt domain-containing protein [Opitutus sp. WL0086]WRQ88114.1 Hpt domain-containing protein [Opitutus sp. WL0086]